MVNVKFSNGQTFSADAPVTIYDAAKASDLIDKTVFAALLNGEPAELTQTISGDCEIQLLTFADREGKLIFRHTASHILAQAVLRLFPTAKLDKGPSTDNGFFYDIDCDTSFSPTF